MILAADIGGTKTLLALFDDTGGHLIAMKRYASADSSDFQALLAEFLLEVLSSVPEGELIRAAGFGIAGPITGGHGAQRVQTTNLPWMLDSAAIARQLGGVPVWFVNDLVASGRAAVSSPLAARVSLNPSAVYQEGHAAVIAAGTGLGEALFFYDGARYHAMPTEGGHADFAPNSALEAELWAFLRTRLNGHVSVERVICGAGFSLLYEFLQAQGLGHPSPHMQARLASAADPNAEITRQGVAGSDALSVQVCQIFARIYGAEAGNLALKSLPLGGVFVAGAIAGHIAPFMAKEFMHGFLDKGRFRGLLETLPVWMVSADDLALKGAAQVAASGLDAA
ncbi:glucokinase [Halothiobacillus sp. DCM-1]|uniref:glucokinase n=1 Tax=Halothiobacillus sp. DCM-1 TaxID=3112558 RepID=UPI003250DF36